MVGNFTYTDITVAWTDSDACDGSYFVSVNSGNSAVRILGFHPAPETTSIDADLGLDWDSVASYDWTVKVECRPSDNTASTIVEEVPLQSGLPDTP